MKLKTRKALNIASWLLVLIAFGLFSKFGFDLYQEAAQSKAYADLAQMAHEVDPQEDNSQDEFWNNLRLKNQDVEGWITLDNTGIDYPVVRPSQDKKDTYYLKHDFENNASFLGCPYIDPRSYKGSKNILIYGHHLANGLMFSSIAGSYQQKSFNELASGYYKDISGAEYKLTPLMSLYIDMSYEPIQRFDFKSQADLDLWLQLIKSSKKPMATHEDLDNQIKSTNQIITLVTCNSAYSNRRYRTALILKAELVKYPKNQVQVANN